MLKTSSSGDSKLHKWLCSNKEAREEEEAVLMMMTMTMMQRALKCTLQFCPSHPPACSCFDPGLLHLWLGLCKDCWNLSFCTKISIYVCLFVIGWQLAGLVMPDWSGSWMALLASLASYDWPDWPDWLCQQYSQNNHWIRRICTIFTWFYLLLAPLVL